MLRKQREYGINWIILALRALLAWGEHMFAGTSSGHAQHWQLESGAWTSTVGS